MDARSGGGSGTNSWGYDAAFRLAMRANASANSCTGARDKMTRLLTTAGSTTTQNLTLTFNRSETGESDTD